MVLDGVQITMKKLIAIILFALCFAPTAYAYIDWYYSTILWTTGLSNISISVRRLTEEMSVEHIFFSGNAIHAITLNDTEIKTFWKDNDTLAVPLSGFLPTRGSYRFWKLNGTIGKIPFSVSGVTSEGTYFYNKLIIPSVIGLLGIGIVSCYFLKRKIRTS